MIIGLCGNEKGKKLVIDEVIKQYGDRVVICDYFKIFFQTIVKYEKVKYDMVKNSDNMKQALYEYRSYVDKKVTGIINEILSNDKEKIILLVSNNILSEDIDKTPFFERTDMKVLVTLSDDISYPLILNNYNIDDFDLVINDLTNLDVKKLLKLKI